MSYWFKPTFTQEHTQLSGRFIHGRYFIWSNRLVEWKHCSSFFFTGRSVLLNGILKYYVTLEHYMIEKVTSYPEECSNTLTEYKVLWIQWLTINGQCTGQEVLVRFADRCIPWNVHILQQPVVSVIDLHGATLVEQQVGCPADHVFLRHSAHLRVIKSVPLTIRKVLATCWKHQDKNITFVSDEFMQNFIFSFVKFQYLSACSYIEKLETLQIQQVVSSLDRQIYNTIVY